MHGNVWQLCADLFDPKESARACRGGCFTLYGPTCEAASRLRDAPTDRDPIVGFRLVRVPVR
jgi:formylglycine-generating enzyme required for sulfatase activity